jgi:hypothetical protein
MDEQRWFEIESPTPEIRSIVVGKDKLGFKIDIYGVNAHDVFEGADTIQDRVSQVIGILHSHIGPSANWVEYDTRAPVHVWDALAALSDLEEP